MIARHSADLIVFTNGSDAVTDADEDSLVAHGIGVERRRIASIEGDRSGMTEVVLDDGVSIPRTAGFVRPIWHAPLGFAGALDLDLDDDGLIVVDRKQRSSVPGIYAAGDVTPGFRQIAVAAGQGTVASSVINRDLLARDR